jgi:aspartyl-tRNA(Asn)/glutamyl-tRNA(Gln) amidotransferase subunit B
MRSRAVVAWPQASLPEAPSAVRARYAKLGLPPADVIILADDLAVARYYDGALAAGAPPKQAANWVMRELMAHCKVLSL